MEGAKFGENLKYYRKKLGMTQFQLGESSGVGQVAIANYERGARFPGEDTLRRLAQTLAVSLDTLLSVSFRREILQNEREPFNLETLKTLLLDHSLLRCREFLNQWKERFDLRVIDVYEEILTPLMHDVGEQWLRGELSIAQEHMISGKIRALIHLTAEDSMKKMVPVRRQPLTWMGFCAPGDEHDMALLMIDQLMRLEGWFTVYLGTNIPLEDLSEAILRYSPEVLCVSCTMTQHLNGLETYLKMLDRGRPGACRIFLGGRVADSMDRKRFPMVDSFCGSLEENVLKAVSS